MKNLRNRWDDSESLLSNKRDCTMCKQLKASALPTTLLSFERKTKNRDVNGQRIKGQ